SSHRHTFMSEKQQAQIVEKAVTWIEERLFTEVRADLGSYEQPQGYLWNDGRAELRPDLTARRNGRKSYFEIATKSDDGEKTAREWKLLRRLADLKDGQLYLFMPEGHRSFTHRLIREHDIKAQLVKI
ncbi:MAG: hypothetical protein R3350_09920, partial [Saprospiraceae bacterium]|nr:hypothetical protein [Saprospiraceae bacterium]